MSEGLMVYRGRTIGLLRRYFRMSVELGRLPSLLGREFFRAKVTSYRMSTFEDVVIFVHDVERCLERLDEFSRRLIARIVLQEHTQAEAARLLNMPLRTVERQFPEALDRLSEIFVRASLLAEIESTDQPQAAQNGRQTERPVSSGAGKVAKATGENGGGEISPERPGQNLCLVGRVQEGQERQRRFPAAPVSSCQEGKMQDFSASA
jgi:hypothetical protein